MINNNTGTGAGVLCTGTPETKSWKENKPWLDWQENRPDNKPEEGVELLVKFKHFETFKYDTCMLINAQFYAGETKYYHPSIVEKWAYIPE